MLTEPISFTGKLTLQDTLDLNYFHFRCVLRRSIRILLGAFSVMIAALIILTGWVTHFVAFHFLVLALCAYYPFGWIIHHRLAVARRYRRTASQFVENTVTFTDDSVSIASVPMDVRLNWDRLQFIVVTPRGLLFLVAPLTPLFWLPRRLFDGNDKQELILKVAADHRVPLRQMS